MSERAYIASGPDPQEGASLVFAPNAREAKRMAWPVVSDWVDCNYTEMRVRWLRSGAEHLREKAGPHVVECPAVCSTCELWHVEPYDANGRCEACAEWADAETGP